MKNRHVKPVFLVASLIVATCAAMAYSDKVISLRTDSSGKQGQNGIVTLSGSLVQSKIIKGGDGLVSLSLTMKADKVIKSEEEAKNVDLVVVLDKSGSMNGNKIEDAKKAVLNLLSELSPKDRFSLISYSNDVQTNSPLVYATDAEKEGLKNIVRQIRTGGGTNLGAGLELGIDLLQNASKTGNIGKVILLSDGQANQGITDLQSLGNMASIAPENNFTVSTAGLGNDFNEKLMTAIANRGTGTYHFIENPAAFASVFQKEYLDSRHVAASSIEIRVPLENGIRLADAAGYQVETREGMAVFHTGDLLSGQTRKIFLTFNLPVEKEKKFEISGISVRYYHNDLQYTASVPKSFDIACIKDPNEAIASIDKSEWGEQVLRRDYNMLKEKVADDIRTGKKQAALERIEEYESRQEVLNSAVRSKEVADNLDTDVGNLRETVEHTFSGNRDEVLQKQKKTSKVLQFEGYRGQKQ